ncbi:MAG TPA: chemotaxis protein CheB [Actinomycetota bacterium]|nr:chemotaxis protein CheB [Actinomycetota bacterium]
MERRDSPLGRANVAPAFEIVAVASSAGGLAALTSLLSGLPALFPAPVLLVQHLDPRHKSLLADMLSRCTELPVKMAEGGDRLTGGSVFVAPPNYHLVVDPGGTLSLTQSELIHFLRPSADILFESVANSFPGRAIAVVLSGTGSDGAKGVKAIKNSGGTVIAQDEDTSEFFGMPSAAIATGSVDVVLPLALIAPALVGLVQPPPHPSGRPEATS